MLVSSCQQTASHIHVQSFAEAQRVIVQLKSLLIGNITAVVAAADATDLLESLGRAQATEHAKPADPGCQCGKELLIVAMGPRFKPLVRSFGRNPPGSGLVRRMCPQSMGGKCMMNA